jgi:hypothetical protein
MSHFPVGAAAGGAFRVRQAGGKVRIKLSAGWRRLQCASIPECLAVQIDRGIFQRVTDGNYKQKIDEKIEEEGAAE